MRKVLKTSQPVKSRILLKLPKIISLLEQHFERKTAIYSASLFSKHRIERGVCLYIIKKYSGDTWDYICQELMLVRENCRQDIRYALSKGSDQIVKAIENKIREEVRKDPKINQAYRPTRKRNVSPASNFKLIKTNQKTL